VLTALSGNLGISATMSLMAGPRLASAKYSTARCCTSASMALPCLHTPTHVRRRAASNGQRGMAGERAGEPGGGPGGGSEEEGVAALTW
jgi:hypothetical protein